MWSLGVILYELSALRLPFARSSLLGLIHAINREPHEPLPYPAGALVDALLEKKPEKRPLANQLVPHPWFLSMNPHAEPLCTILTRDWCTPSALPSEPTCQCTTDTLSGASPSPRTSPQSLHNQRATCQMVNVIVAASPVLGELSVRAPDPLGGFEEIVSAIGGPHAKRGGRKGKRRNPRDTLRLSVSSISGDSRVDMHSHRSGSSVESIPLKHQCSAPSLAPWTPGFASPHSGTLRPFMHSGKLGALPTPRKHLAGSLYGTASTSFPEGYSTTNSQTTFLFASDDEDQSVQARPRAEPRAKQYPRSTMVKSSSLHRSKTYPLRKDIPPPGEDVHIRLHDSVNTLFRNRARHYPRRLQPLRESRFSTKLSPPAVTRLSPNIREKLRNGMESKKTHVRHTLAPVNLQAFGYELAAKQKY